MGEPPPYCPETKMKRWNELTTPEQHLATTGEQIDYWYVTSFWLSDSTLGVPSSELYSDYDTIEEALEGLAEANELDGITTSDPTPSASEGKGSMHRMTILERSIRDREMPITSASILAMSETSWHVQLDTVVGCTCVDSDTVAVLSSRDAAAAYVAEHYGITQQGMDGDIGFDRWWLA